MTEFNLSDKITSNLLGKQIFWIKKEDAKEFIKRLKVDVCYGFTKTQIDIMKERIDSLAGKELL